MNFSEVKAFFKSWGMFPSAEDCNEGVLLGETLNSDVIEQGINSRVYGKLCKEAMEQHGEKFWAFCTEQINAVDDAFYLDVDTWKNLESRWKAKNKGPMTQAEASDRFIDYSEGWLCGCDKNRKRLEPRFPDDYDRGYADGKEVYQSAMKKETERLKKEMEK